ncbi:FAD-binding and (Fe-S)-binding domain-containing protein [Actinotalea sp. K2]|uniref:FAD-binding and (Fe-S)-binding domain-containing protein n=1 Tax=Actinotalea sp. K2 TaxID=2939438 RepID=UPI0020177259|nr:FAD-binding and (Fe-S)-binding domain-containing protein [Actinotalea sp. K2]MCL3861727.1 FAD-binding oxidoreductase [Actinotalea sp. K2]
MPPTSAPPATDDGVLDLLRAALSPEQVRTGAIDVAAMAHDASHYLLTPRAVVTPRTAAEVASLLRVAAGSGTPVTFRSGGTSLSGQASTAGLLVDTRRRFTEVEVLDDGRRVRCQPGVTLRQVNARLARYGRRLGPDPASELACTIGGVVANNSSGMTAGTTQTAYRTVDSLVLVLPSGTVLDTAAPGADDRLRRLEPDLWTGLLRLRDRVRDDAALRAEIERQFAMKNTMGYGLNALLDHDTAVEMLAHLVIGSEGTLAFVAEVTFATVPALPFAATGLLVFDDVATATGALAPLVDSGAHAVELLDAASLRVAQADPQAADVLRSIAVDRHTALLVEYQAGQAAELADAVVGADPVLAALRTSAPVAPLTRDPAARASLWRTRKGLYTAVAGARAPGTTALLEDVVVPPDALPATVADLTRLFDVHGYDEAVVFGHAKDANLHFMITPHLDDRAEVERYARFTDDLVDLVLGRGGSLKAEHGTGRIMAPFVRRQYGDALYEVMVELKRLCDPRGVLNPGVLLDEDPDAHLRDLKPSPPVHPELDRCVECGYCEPTCPSRDVTTTPRQRIVLLREIAVSSPERRAELTRDFDYSAVQTCAADSLCVAACPVGIDTGKVMKELRADAHGPFAQRAGAAVARHFGGVSTGLRAGLGLAATLPAPLTAAASALGRAVLGTDLVPSVGPDLPGPGPRRPAGRAPAGSAVVLFPSCTGSLFEAAPSAGPGAGGADDVGLGATAAFLALCERAGLPVAVPEGVDALCCGTPWASKGFTVGHDAMAGRTFEALWTASGGGALPVVCDASSCSHGLQGLRPHLTAEAGERFDQLLVLDAVTYVRREVLPRLTPARQVGSMVVHPTCSTVHLDGMDDLMVVAAAAAEEVTVPVDWGCCGFAGDRGMLHPELTAAATAPEAAEVAGHDADAYVSANRTCEMGMSRATGRTYRHVLEVLEVATRV